MDTSISSVARCTRTEMAFLLLLALLSLSSSAHGYGPGRWINAHATFYGGGDASGTMG